MGRTRVQDVRYRAHWYPRLGQSFVHHGQRIHERGMILPRE